MMVVMTPGNDQCAERQDAGEIKLCVHGRFLYALDKADMK